MIEERGGNNKRTLLWLGLLGFWALFSTSSEGKPVEVRFQEGVMQGYIALSTPGGERIADGEISQVATGPDRVAGRMVLRFHDGSQYDETVMFSQTQAFKLLRYSVEHKGPSFPQPLKFSLDGETGAYSLTLGGPSQTSLPRVGTLALPSDVYNGMTVTLLKNIPPSRETSFHVVGVSDDPTLYSVVAQAVDVDEVKTGRTKAETVHYSLRPTLGWLTKTLAWLFSETIPEYHVWLTKSDIPAFVQFEGPLYVGGPTWRIVQTSPRLSASK